MLAIARRIQIDSPVRASLFLDEIYDRCQQLAQFPLAWRLLPRHEDKGIRRRPFGNYLIFYTVAEETINVLHVLHGARDYERILFPEN